MIEDNTYEENVKDFNRMFNDLDDKDFNWDTHTMIDNVVVKIEVEYMINYVLDNSNFIYIDRFRDVLKWADHQKFICPRRLVPSLSYSGAAPFGYGEAAPSGYSKPTPKRRKQFAVGRDGRRIRKKYL